MKSTPVFWKAGLASLGLALFAALPAAAQENFPSKQLTLLIPYGPGAASDVVARIFGEGLARQLGQTVVPVNKPGANGMIAVRQMLAQPMDGYTLLFQANGIVFEQVMKKNANFDVRKDVLPVARISQAPLGLFASNKLPANTPKEFVDYVRKNPGKVNFASVGVGSTAHLTTERLRLAAGLDMVHVPYPAGTAPVLTALIAGDVGIYINEMGSMKTFVAEKKLKVLATLNDKRSTLYPDAPAITEAGIPELKNFKATFFYGIFVEPSVNPARVDFLANAINKTLTDPTVRERLTTLGYDPALLGGTNPAEFRKFVNDELANVEATVRDAKIPQTD